MTQIQVDEDLKPLSVRSAFRRAAAEARGLRRSLRRVRARPRPARVGRRDAGRPVRLDRAQPRRRGRRRRRRLRHVRAERGPAGGKDAGRVYVYSTKTGKLLWKADGAPADELGTGVELAGDTNKDGVPDVVAGAPGGGKAYIYSGKDGRVLQTLDGRGRRTTRSAATSRRAGDVDHDGYDDVLIGAPTNAAGGKDAGRAYLYSGKDGRKLMTWTGEREGDQFGSTVAGYTKGKTTFLMIGAPNAGPKQDRPRLRLRRPRREAEVRPRVRRDRAPRSATCSCPFPGDLDGDGVADLYATDFANTAKGRRPAAPTSSPARPAEPPHADGRGRGRGIRHRPATAGDVDGDGRPDLIVGAWQYAGAAVSGGRAYLYSGKDGKLLKTYTCRIPGDTFGFDAVGMGDTDGDGTIDFLITSAWSGIKGNHSGRVFLISSGVKKKS